MDNDRDMDGIPDRIDNSFNTPGEVLEIKGIVNPVYMRADKEKLSKLANTEIPFCIRKNDGEYGIICDRNDIGKVRAVMDRQAHQSRKAR